MKNIDIINRTISERTGIDEDVVKAVNKYFWKHGVKKNLSTLNDNALFIRGLGTIVVSRYNLRKMIYATIGKIRGIRNSTKFKETTREIYLEELYGRLRRLLKSRNELAKQYKNEHDKRIPQIDPNSN